MLGVPPVSPLNRAAIDPKLKLMAAPPRAAIFSRGAGMTGIFEPDESQQDAANKIGRFVSISVIGLLAVLFAYGYLWPFI
jgi:hypothetical protein